MAEPPAAKEAVIRQFAEDLAARDPFLVAIETLQRDLIPLLDALAALDVEYLSHRPGAYVRLGHMEGADALAELGTTLTHSAARVRDFARRP